MKNPLPYIVGQIALHEVLADALTLAFERLFDPTLERSVASASRYGAWTSNRWVGGPGGSLGVLITNPYTFSDNTVENGALYHFWVRGRNEGGFGPPSNRVSAVPVAAAPAKPAELTATAGNGRVTLGWTAQSAATGWEYRQKTTGAFGDWRYIRGSGADEGPCN